MNERIPYLNSLNKEVVVFSLTFCLTLPSTFLFVRLSVCHTITSSSSLYARVAQERREKEINIGVNKREGTEMGENSPLLKKQPAAHDSMMQRVKSAGEIRTTARYPFSSLLILFSLLSSLPIYIIDITCITTIIPLHQHRT